MGYSLPRDLTQWLDKDWRRPPQNFVDCSLYYANLDVYFMQYMRNVVRPCVAYSTGCADNTFNSGIKLNIGKTIKDTAVKLVKGDKILFDGDDFICKQISDIWAPKVGFETFVESALDYMLTGGTTVVKLNKDRASKVYPTALRVDRYYTETDDFGNVVSIIMFNSFLFTQDYGKGVKNQYWLVEDRHYNQQGAAVVEYKVHVKSGIAGHEILPNPYDAGIAVEELPTGIQRMLMRRGIVLNKELTLPYHDGLGVWLWRRTANNSCVPGLCMGDPILYGALDIIWAADVAFSGSVTDIILGKGKILVPKRFLSQVRDDFKKLGIKTEVVFSDDYSDDDDSLVYLLTERDKDFTPQAVQFNIRSEAYRGMLEIYLRQAVTHCGFAPTSIFPFLQDQSAKTATEVTAEENLTRATIQSIHQTIVPSINRLLDEVLYQYGFKGNVHIKLTDYIGNKILRDQNIRDNYSAGLVPFDIAVQRINDISAGETQEYILKIREEKQQQAEMMEQQIWERLANGNNNPAAQFTGDSVGRSGDENSTGGEI